MSIKIVATYYATSKIHATMIGFAIIIGAAPIPILQVPSTAVECIHKYKYRYRYMDTL